MSGQNPDDLSEFRYWHKGRTDLTMVKGKEATMTGRADDGGGEQRRVEDPIAPGPVAANNTGGRSLLATGIAAVSLLMAAGLMYIKSG
ncbi:unnamed protein product [Rhizoctonia solani]|uniref:Uncharacterized protein n=1 Tax=Rhizoctonia solani TaxID=456999 RepID=A0A8H3B4X6_9AGAM|nr:unnamed protein product [Rhizoctonia solani]